MEGDKLVRSLGPEVFEVFGKYAGIGGLVVASLLVFFMGVLYLLPQIFGKNRADFRDVMKLLRTMILCFFALSLAGLASWLLSLFIEAQKDQARKDLEVEVAREETKRRQVAVQSSFISLTFYVADAASVDEAVQLGKTFFAQEELGPEARDSIIQAHAMARQLRSEGITLSGNAAPPPEQLLRMVSGSAVASARSLQCEGIRRYLVENHRLVCSNGAAISYLSWGRESQPVDPRFFMIHATASSQRAGALAEFLRTRDASYHLIVDRDGAVIQLVDFDKVAFHAGASEYRGLSGLNRYSLGIGLVNAMQLKCEGEKDSGCTSVYYSSEVVSRDDVKEATAASGETTYWQSFTPEQLHALNGILAALALAYGPKEIIGHEHVSQRKSDPGPAFPWAHFGQKAAAH